ncbi:MAG: ShlB/FhaC/HecB family hemolysin secretion/activation protein, partial [Phycisphaeraceae bacterium]
REQGAVLEDHAHRSTLRGHEAVVTRHDLAGEADRPRVRPLQAGDEPRAGSLIQRGALDDFLYRLNRHPGRRVDAAISPGVNAGEVSLDYLVAENKPWYTYFQLSNTGTESTGEWRERFGFVHNQVTNNDDILSIDYITSGFDDSHVVTLNYRRPLDEYWQLRLNGLYSNFTADQVGSPLAFTGEDTAVGASLAFNFFQQDALFLDAVGGLEYYYTSANNPAATLEGEANLLMGSLGVELERITDLAQTRGVVKFRGNLNQGNANDFNTLGRTAPDTQFLVMQYALTHSFFLEPLLNRAAWENIADPSTSTLAHEIALGMRGQWAIADDRLIPTFQAVAGGLYTVRGYEQAEVAGDSSIILSAEYRFHLPRIFGPQAPTQTPLFDRPFRYVPESVYGRPDWDFVLKAFVDYAFIDVTDELAFETDENLASAGLGFELSVKNNVSVRAEWGFALEDAGRTDAGDSQFHFVLTLLY